MKPRLKLRFCDFHRRLPQSLDYFRALLASRYALDEKADPDFVIYSNYGRTYRDHRCVRIFYSMENERPDFGDCDYALTFDYLDDPRHYRLPYYIMQQGIDRLAPRVVGAFEQTQRELAERAEFCAFVHSNPFGACRNRVFQRLAQYKPVMSGGRFRNNLGYQVEDKLAFMQNFKFAFAFENDASPGYTTEKLVEVYLAGAIPIYWGNPRVAEEFNPRAMLCRHDFSSDQALVDRVVEIDQDDALWITYRREPCFLDDRMPESLESEHVLAWFEGVFRAEADPVAARSSVWTDCARHTSPSAISRRIRRLARHSVKGVRLATGW